MISFLEGVLEEALPTQIIVNVHGVGYHVMIPLSSFERLSEPGSRVKILTHLVVREDSHTLYGFGTLAERDLFRLLLNHVSGVGPKLASGDTQRHERLKCLRPLSFPAISQRSRASEAWAKRRLKESFLN